MGTALFSIYEAGSASEKVPLVTLEQGSSLYTQRSRLSFPALQEVLMRDRLSGPLAKQVRLVEKSWSRLSLIGNSIGSQASVVVRRLHLFFRNECGDVSSTTISRVRTVHVAGEIILWNRVRAIR
jgi:hypothetical protein